MSLSMIRGRNRYEGSGVRARPGDGVTRQRWGLGDCCPLVWYSDGVFVSRSLVGPLIPPGRRGGRRRSVDVRAVLNGVLYVLETGCRWRHLPTDFPPRSTCHSYLQLWAWEGTLERTHHELYVRVREQFGRDASPTAAVVDSQSVRSAEKGGRPSTRLGTTRAKRSRTSSITP